MFKHREREREGKGREIKESKTERDLRQGDSLGEKGKGHQ